MYPLLYDGYLKVHTVGVLIGLSFCVGYWLAWRGCRRDGLETTHVNYLVCLCLWGAGAGALLFGLVFEGGSGGNAFYGGVLLPLLLFFVYCRWNRIRTGAYLDLMAPGLAIGIMLGRLGCFAAGCCWGVETSLPWAVQFPALESPGAPAHPVHPTQLYDSLCGALLLGYVLWRLPRRQFSGQAFLHLGVGYSVLRFFTEFLRGDHYRGYLFGGALSSSQFVSLLIWVSLITAFLAKRLIRLPTRRTI